MGTKLKFSISVAIATFSMLFVVTQAPASSEEGSVSEAQLIANLDGNPDCQAISNNSNVMEAKVYRPEWSGSLDLGESSQTVDYMVSHDGVLSWVVNNDDESEADIRINSVIINSKSSYMKSSKWDESGESDNSQKSQRSKKSKKSHKSKKNSGVRVYHFGDAGATEDSGETGQQSEITKIRFCYGLVADAPPAQAFEDTIPVCSASTGIVCPVESEPMLYIGLSLLNDNFDPSSQSEDEKDSWCTCGTITLQECDPAADAGTENACNLPLEDEGEYPEYPQLNFASQASSDADVPEGVVPRVPVLIQAVETPDSYICRVRKGRRRCYNH